MSARKGERETLLNGCAFHACEMYVRGSVWAAEEADQDDRATRSASFDVTGDTRPMAAAAAIGRRTSFVCIHFRSLSAEHMMERPVSFLSLSLSLSSPLNRWREKERDVRVDERIRSMLPSSQKTDDDGSNPSRFDVGST